MLPEEMLDRIHHFDEITEILVEDLLRAEDREEARLREEMSE